MGGRVRAPGRAGGWEAVGGAASYVVWQRRTDEPGWIPEPVLRVPADGADGAGAAPHYSVILPGVRGDDWLFGVSACAASDQCSPVASAVPAGAFAPIGK